ncbi:MAG: oligosaccharide flippase family protein [Clostridium sp.]|nr:oligosaccharide flippase family protein [Clostridium sp.]
MTDRQRHNRPKGGGALTRRVYRVLGIFTGTQMLSLICSVIRTKLIALWTGAAGVGLFGLYNVAVEMVSTLTQLGLRGSAVRDIAAAPPGRRPTIIAAVRRWGLWLGFGGMVFAIVASPLLAIVSFGNTDRWLSFALLSVVMLAGSVNNAEQAVMQGTGTLRRLASASLWGTVAALLLSVPMVWFWRLDAVVPVIVVYSLAMTASTLALRGRPTETETATPSAKETVALGRGFIRLGIYMTVSGFAVWLASYLLMSWIGREAGEDAVGYYQAGNTLLIRYVGILFAAISMEFYPRLSSIAENRRHLGVYLNHEIITILRVAAPLAVLFVIAAPLIVRVLYSGEFLVIVPYITIGITGVILRAAAWCMSYVVLARGDGRLFMITEILSATVYLALSVGCFRAWGVTGFGVAFLLWYLVYLAGMVAVIRLRYVIRLRRPALLWLAGSLVATAAAAAVTLLI